MAMKCHQQPQPQQPQLSSQISTPLFEHDRRLTQGATSAQNGGLTRAECKDIQHMEAVLREADPSLTAVFNQSSLDWDQFIKTPFVALVGTIIGRLVRYSQARAVRQRLYDKLGGVDFDHDALAALLDDAAACRSLGLPLDTARVLHDLCRHVKNYGAVQAANDIRRVGNSVPGVGPWAVSSALVTSMLDHDAFPAADLWLRRKMALLDLATHDPRPKRIRPLTIEQAKARSLVWQPYRAIVVAHLWRWFDAHDNVTALAAAAASVKSTTTVPDTEADPKCA